MRSIRPFGILALGLTIGGCATIINGSRQTITVNSNTDGAQVYLKDSLLGKTPLTASIKRGQTGVLKVTKDGYTPYSIALNKKVTSMFWVNIFSGGTFGSTTDYATGAMYEYEPSTYMVSLQPGTQSDDEKNAWVRREGLRGFVLNNSEALVSDLAAGHGEHIDVLIQVIGVKAMNRPEAVNRWRALYAASKTAAEFATTIVGELEH